MGIDFGSRTQNLGRLIKLHFLNRLFVFVRDMNLLFPGVKNTPYVATLKVLIASS